MSSGRLLWEEYTTEGISSLGANNYRRAERFFNRALVQAEQLGPQEKGISLNGLGELYRREGRREEAERMFRRALDVKETALGPHHPDVATTLVNLALLYVAGRRSEEAAPLVERALTIQEKRLGTDHPSHRRMLILLADIYRELGRADEAFIAEVRARMLREEEPPRER